MGFFQVANLVFEIGGVFQGEIKILLNCDLHVKSTIQTDLPECIIAYSSVSVRGKKITHQVLLLYVCYVFLSSWG